MISVPMTRQAACRARKIFLCSLARRQLRRGGLAELTSLTWVCIPLMGAHARRATIECTLSMELGQMRIFPKSLLAPIFICSISTLHLHMLFNSSTALNVCSPDPAISVVCIISVPFSFGKVLSDFAACYLRIFVPLASILTLFSPQSLVAFGPRLVRIPSCPSHAVD